MKKIRNFGLSTIGVMGAISPVAAVVACGKESKGYSVQQSITTIKSYDEYQEIDKKGGVYHAHVIAAHSGHSSITENAVKSYSAVAPTAPQGIEIKIKTKKAFAKKMHDKVFAKSFEKSKALAKARDGVSSMEWVFDNLDNPKVKNEIETISGEFGVNFLEMLYATGALEGDKAMETEMKNRAGSLAPTELKKMIGAKNFEIINKMMKKIYTELRVKDESLGIMQGMKKIKEELVRHDEAIDSSGTFNMQFDPTFSVYGIKYTIDSSVIENKDVNIIHNGYDLGLYVLRNVVAKAIRDHAALQKDTLGEVHVPAEPTLISDLKAEIEKNGDGEKIFNSGLFDGVTMQETGTLWTHIKPSFEMPTQPTKEQEFSIARSIIIEAIGNKNKTGMSKLAKLEISWGPGAGGTQKVTIKDKTLITAIKAYATKIGRTLNQAFGEDAETTKLISDLIDKLKTAVPTSV